MNEAELIQAGKHFSAQLTSGDVVLLEGDLGAGKTTFTRAVLAGLGYEGRVKSPTYPILETYSLPQFIFQHYDLYRLKSIDELEQLGFVESLHEGAVTFIEWPKIAEGFLPGTTCRIQIEVDAEGRVIHFL